MVKCIEEAVEEALRGHPCPCGRSDDWLVCEIKSGRAIVVCDDCGRGGVFTLTRLGIA